MFFPLSAAPCVSTLFANDGSAQKCPNGKKGIQLLMARAGTISEHSRGAAPRAVIFQRKRMSQQAGSRQQAVCTEDSGEGDAGEWAVFTVSKETSNTTCRLR